AFRAPLAGVEWALDCVDALKELEWEDELLSHELCEEVVTAAGAPAPAPPPPPPAQPPSHPAQPAPAAVAHTASTSSLGRLPHSPSPLGPLAASPKSSFSFLSALHEASSRAHGHWSRESSPPAGRSLSQGRSQGTCKSLRPTSLSGEASPAVTAPQLELTVVAARGAAAATAGTAAAAAAVTHGSGGGLGKVSNLRIIAASKRSHERGLRVKVGLDVGPVTYSLTASSGRLSYRGRVMNRAARIAGKAAAGQVLCSGAVWQACETAMALGCSGGSRPSGDCSGDMGGSREDSEGELCRGIVGVSLGKVALKGISAPVEVVQCTRGT
ncbi:hypothetical protein Agub_g2041, partial [Astrephomene gubernaculifera]